MAVAELSEHVGADVEELFGRHLVAYLFAVAFVDIVPVYAFFGKETVAGVENCPELFEGSARVGLIFPDFVAGSRQQERRQQGEYMKSFHQ